jgi:hypothetical protein
MSSGRPAASNPRSDPARSANGLPIHKDLVMATNQANELELHAVLIGPEIRSWIDFPA